MNNNLIAKNLKQSKRLKAMIHILITPKGVSEKSINRAAHSMSGRNIATDLERIHNIRLKKPRRRLKARDGSLYSLYELQDIDQVYKLIELIKHHCLIHKLPMLEELLINKAKINFEYYFKNNTAKKG